MRTLLLLLTMAAIFASCSKDSSTTPKPQQLNTTFKFTGNGTNVQWNGSSPLSAYPIPEGSTIEKITSGTQTFYLLVAQPAGGGIYSPHLYLKIEASNLVSGTYPKTLSTAVNWTVADNECIMPGGSGIYAATSEVGDFATIIITSIHDNGYADGTFTAKMTTTPIGSYDKLNITNGEFHNVKIVQ